MSVKPRKKTRLYLIASVVVVLAAGGFWYYQQSTSKKAEDKPLLVKVDMGSIENTIAAAGTLKPRNYVDVGAQVSGQIKKLHVEIGDMVKEGQLLAEIDAQVQQTKVEGDRAAVEALMAQVDGRKVALQVAQVNADRQTRLRDANAASQVDYDTAMNTLASAKSSLDQLMKQIDQSQATLKSDEQQLGYANIYAPVSGTVVSISLLEGTTLNAVQMAPTVLRIADLSTMTVEADISEADISNIKPGMTVYFTTLGGGDRRWYSKVRQIWPTPNVTNNVVLYTGLFDVDNADSSLYQEMTAQVYFVTASAQNVITVPVGALKFNRGGRGPGGGAPQFAGAAGGPAATGSAPAGAAGPPAGFTPQAAGGQGQGQNGAGAPPSRRGAGNGRPTGQGSGGFAGMASTAPRPATVVVMKNDGTREERQVMVGVQSRVAAEVISGLSVGEEVVAGIIQANAAAAGGNQQQNRPGGFPGGFPGGGFPGGRF
ncbi:MAG TPA: efflux RND transporter periplasmic adaptor subunit [Candidatus Acidoferrum sp.]|nr:efflux RND transporter periplasmic adaptor subunit [Candidatus Acidoferrum sp.]